jgi:hypothetical protein
VLQLIKKYQASTSPVALRRVFIFVLPSVAAWRFQDW